MTITNWRKDLLRREDGGGENIDALFNALEVNVGKSSVQTSSSIESSATRELVDGGGTPSTNDAELGQPMRLSPSTVRYVVAVPIESQG